MSEETTTIVWEDPPALKNAYMWKDRLRPLMGRPGCWAKFEMNSGNSAYASVTRLRQGRLSHPPGVWEFIARQDSVYARYIGPETE